MVQFDLSARRDKDDASYKKLPRGKPFLFIPLNHSKSSITDGNHVAGIRPSLSPNVDDVILRMGAGGSRGGRHHHCPENFCR